MGTKIFLAVSTMSVIVYTFILFLSPPNTAPLLTKNTPYIAVPTTTPLSLDAQITTIYTIAKTDPALAIISLKEFIADQPASMNECHEIAHEIGHISYKHFGEQAFAFKDPLCGGGYLHGLIETATIFDETMSLAGIVHTVCFGDVEESCLHGLGHAIYKSVLDIPASLRYCDKVRTNNKDCYDGVYMEVFDREEGPDFSVAAGIEICATATTPTKLSCLFYLPRLLKNNEPSTVTSLCTDFLEQSEQLTCAQGSGVMFMKYASRFELDTVTKQCGTYIDTALRNACTIGVNAYYKYGNVTNTEW